MKTFLTLFVLLFSSSVFADDISDFQIEGMSIGDSLLDYFSEKEIIQNTDNNIYNYIKEKKFTIAGFNKFPFFETYDYVQVNYLIKDKKYQIYGVGGVIFYDEIIVDCYKKRDKISEELSNIFKGAIKTGPDFIKHAADKSGKSTSSAFAFWFESGSLAFVECNDWSTQMSYIDSLRVGLSTSELNEWLE